MDAFNTKCPQCGSRECGVIRCRFSMVDHRDFKAEKAERQCNFYLGKPCVCESLCVHLGVA